MPEILRFFMIEISKADSSRREHNELTDRVTLEAERSIGLNGDPRWELVLRVAASRTFAKSERLSSFLLFVSELVLLGQSDKIKEQNIGESVFGRPTNYDTSIDAIVRSHATRLRQRLERYFTEEGLHEAFILEIPPGAYVPVFTARSPKHRVDAQGMNPDIAAVDKALHEPVLEPAHTPYSVAGGQSPRDRNTIRALRIGLALCLVWMIVSVIYLATHPRQIDEARNDWRMSHHPLWKQLFNNDSDTLIVNADSALIILEGLAGRPVTLEEYINSNYEKTLSANLPLGELAANLGSRRYTSVVDLGIVQRFFRLPGVNLDRTSFRFARDVHLSDLKNRNIVLLGASASNPWVKLFEPRMNFYFEKNWGSEGFLIVNRSPRSNEQARYDYISNPEGMVYGVVAFQPNLDSSGDVLMLEGQTVAGTEAAADFVFDDTYLKPFLNKIRAQNGTIPHFEVLLRTKSLAGDSSRLEVLAYRVEGS
jgi:hypothetical protein